MENCPFRLEVVAIERHYGGRSIEEAERYGKPCIGSVYTSQDDTHRYRLDDEAVCVICGRKATETHHSPPLGASRLGLWTLRTPRGMFLLKPALFALCRDCHERFHAHRVTANWVWDAPEYEAAWWDGEILTKARPHSNELYRYGHWVFTWPGGGFTYRDLDTIERGRYAQD